MGKGVQCISGARQMATGWLCMCTNNGSQALTNSLNRLRRAAASCQHYCGAVGWVCCRHGLPAGGLFWLHEAAQEASSQEAGRAASHEAQPGQLEWRWLHPLGPFQRRPPHKVPPHKVPHHKVLPHKVLAHMRPSQVHQAPPRPPQMTRLSRPMSAPYSNTCGRETEKQWKWKGEMGEGPMDEGQHTHASPEAHGGRRG